MNWGDPQPDENLVQVLERAAQEVEVIEIVARAENNPGGAWRAEFLLEVDTTAFEQYFNSPDEYRGHFYKDPEQGRIYQSNMLWKVVRKLNIDQMYFDLSKYWDMVVSEELHWDPKQFANADVFLEHNRYRLRETIFKGKTFPVEYKPEFEQRAWAGTRYSPNDRWLTTGKDDQYWEPQFQGMRSDLVAQGLHDQYADNLQAWCDSKSRKDDPMLKMATSFWSWKGDKALIDVKGEWSDGYVPRNKVLRSLQLKWFGVS